MTVSLEGSPVRTSDAMRFRGCMGAVRTSVVGTGLRPTAYAFREAGFTAFTDFSIPVSASAAGPGACIRRVSRM